MLLILPITELGRSLPALLGLLIAGTAHGGNGGWWPLIAAGVVMALSVTRWFTTRFRITPVQVQLRHGLLRRQTVSAPLDRVRTVDVTAHPLHRALGLARVVIGTGMSDRKRHGGLTLDGLPSSAALALRAELLHWRGVEPVPADSPVPGAPAGAASAPDASAVLPMPPPPAPEVELARLDPRWIRYAPFTLSGAITGLALLGFGWRVISEGDVHLSRIGVARSTGHWLQTHGVLLDAAAVLVLVAAFIAVASTAGYLLAFWNFRLSRHSGGSLHVSRGLLTTRATSIERRRLAGAELSEPLLLRAVGGARCLAIATGLRVGRGSERGGEMLAPPAPARTVVAIAGVVLDDQTPFTIPLVPHPPAAKRRRLLRAYATAALAIATVAGAWTLFGIPGRGWLAALVLLLLAWPLGVDRWRSLGHALTDRYVVTRYGSLVRRRCVVAREAVIGWNLRASWFQRRQGVATLVATTAAGRQGYRITDLPPADAVRFASTSTPGLLEQFLA
jgi:putative membrane protein